MPRPPSKKFLDRKERVGKILPILKKTYPAAKCSLDHASPLELLVATILSAQSTDERVNIVTKELFRKYTSAKAYAKVAQEELEKDIHSTGFFRNKAKSIRAMAQALLDQHNGQVPQTMETLFELPGVGRKTANVVLGNAFGINVGITVDTHVTRLSNRLGLTDHKTDAVKIEQDLMPLVPQEDWGALVAFVDLSWPGDLHREESQMRAMPDPEVLPGGEEDFGGPRKSDQKILTRWMNAKTPKTPSG